MIAGSESFIGGDDQHRTRRDGGREIVEVQCRLVIVDFTGQRCAAGAGERNKIVVLFERLGLVFNRGRSSLEMAAILVLGSDVPGGDEDRARNLRIVRDGGSRHISAHAVADHDNAAGIDAIFCSILRIEYELDLGVGVFGSVLEREISLHSPGAAVVHGQHVPAAGTHGLGEIEVLLKSGEAMKNDCRRVRAGSGGEIENPQQHAAVAGENHLLHGGGNVGRRSCSSRRLSG